MINGDVKATKGKAFFAPIVDLPQGLFGQVLLWTGGPADNLNVISLVVTVEGRRKNPKLQ